MDNAIYAALTRQSGLMREMRTVANNMANASTPGFRAEGVVFSEHMTALDGRGETLSMASWKAKPSALFAVAFSMATISAPLMKENEPVKMSIPPQPARTLGICRLNGCTLFCGKRVQTLPIE